jgi:hypothetical protein
MTGGLGSISRAPIYRQWRNSQALNPELQKSTLAEHEICSDVRTLLPGLYTIKFIANSCIVPLQFQKLSQFFISAHDEPLFVAMRVLLALLVVVENGYD